MVAAATPSGDTATAARRTPHVLVTMGQRRQKMTKPNDDNRDQAVKTAEGAEAYQSPDVDTILADTLPAIAGTDACGGSPNIANGGDCANF